MSVIWNKVWFDLWHSKLRTLLVVLSISVGVFAVGATFGLSDQMLPAMDGAHRQSRPSQVTMFTTRTVDRDTIRALARIPGISGAEGYNTVDVRYKLRPGQEWKKGSILMRDSYEVQLYDELQLKAGEWPQGRLISIERMHAPFYGVDIGDQVFFEIDGEEKPLTISGKMRHPFVPPPSMYDWAFFFSGEEVMDLLGIPPGQFTQIKFNVSPYSEQYVRQVATEAKDWLARQNIGVAATLYQDPNKHWGRAFIDGVTVVTQALAVLSLLLSIVLVLNTLTAVITQQTNQIGILKAVGATSFTITRVYLAGVLFIGILSLLVALPLGMLASFSVSRWFLGLYNIDMESFSYSTTAVWLMVISALIFPLLAALYPVLNGARLSVRSAIASYGLGGDFGSGWLDRAIERIAGKLLISYYAMSVANTFRRKGRLLLTELVLVTAGVMFLMVMSMSTSLTATLDSEYGRRTHDIIVNFEDYERVDRTRHIAESIPGVVKAEMWLAAPATILRQGQKSLDAGMGSQIQGVPVDDPMFSPLIVEGRWLQPGDQHVVVMNKDTADDEGIHVGDMVSLELGQYGESEWRVVGLYRTFLMFGGGFNIDAIYAPRPAVYEAIKKTGKGTTLLVRTQAHSFDDVGQTLSLLQDAFTASHIEIFQSETIPSLRRTSDISFQYVVAMLLVLAISVALEGGIGLMGALWIGVIERTKEIGILRAIGARSGVIIRMFILEGLLQGMLSWGLAVPIAVLVTPILANALGMAMFQNEIDYAFNTQATLTWLAIVVILSVLASLIPARHAAQVNVRQSITYE